MSNYLDVFENLPPRPLPPPDATPTDHYPLPTVTHTPPQIEHITKLGHTTLWVVFALMLLSSIAFIATAWKVAIPKRLFYQLTTFTAIITTFSYYAMATHSGFSFHDAMDVHRHKHDIPDTRHLVFRQIFWARFLQWFLTTPLILINLGTLAGMCGSNILNLVAANAAVILTGLFASYGHGRSKWGWYAMSWVAFLFVLWHLGTNARVSANKKGVTKVYVPLMFFTGALWFVYLIIWGISDISRYASPDITAIVYAVLDVLAIPVFGFWLLGSHRREKASQVDVDGVWAEGVGQREGLLRVGEGNDA
ncbi:Opsin-1 [Dactylella cylindrospora]|nr:Opsin-1 [Dactylella cylindrospora]